MINKQTLFATTAAIIALSAGLSAKPLAAPSACESDALHCHFSDRGLVISKSESIGNELTVMETAAQQYERYFGSRPAPGVIITGEAIQEVDVTKMVLEEGYSAVLPWLSNADKIRIARSHIRGAIKKQQPDISDEDLERSIEASLAAMTSEEGDSSNGTEDGALAHELSHIWFISEFWPKHMGRDHVEASYGGPGPDWLDEMAAVLAENDLLTQSRRKHLSELDFSDSELSFYPLEEYFTMEHPMAESAQAMAARQREARGSGESKVEIQALVVTDDELEEFEGRDPSVFYTQSRAIADFLISRTGNERIFAEITSHIIGGGSVGSWLKAVEATYDLPASVADLERAWQDWVQRQQSVSS